jgi:DNA-binding CsgD family transcriptional regulator
MRFFSLCQEIFKAIAMVQQMLNLGNISKWLSAEHVTGISHREKEVLKLLSEGMIHKAIADCLCISTHTVKTHRKNLLKKLNAKSTKELIERAGALGLISED